MRKYWPLLALLLVVLVVPAFAQEVPACQVQAVGGTFVNDLSVNGKVGIGLAPGTVPTSKLDVSGNIKSSGDIVAIGTITGAQYCIGNNCIQQWPAGAQADGTGGWTEAAGTTSTNKKVGVSNDLETTGTVKATGLAATGLANCDTVDTDANGNLVCGVDQTGAAANTVTGSGNANILAKWAGANQIDNSVIFENSGQIGIGTANPSEKLEVAGNIKAATIGGTIIKGDTICVGADCRQAWPAGGGGGGGVVSWVDILNRPAGLDDGDQVGITNAEETDPTVPANVKNGIVDWAKVQNIPPELADGDQVGIITETDPKVGMLEANKWCKSDGNKIICGTDLPALDELDPTVPANIKDGVSWAEVSGKPNIISGTGAADKITKWTAAGLGESIITEAGNAITVAGKVTGTELCIGNDCKTAWPTSPANAVTGGGTANKLTKWISGSAVSSSMIADTGNAIGIGVPSPTKTLDVAGEIKGTALCIGDDCRYSWSSVESGLTGSGTDNKLAKWSTGSLIDSGITETEGGVEISGNIKSDSAAVTSLASCTGKIYTDETGALKCGTDETGLATETDPKIGQLIADKWCTTDGSTVTCASDLPAVNELDPTVPDEIKQGKVSWANIQNIPDGFIDGIDNGITNEDEIDPTVPADIKAGIVDWANVQNIPPELADGDQVGILEEIDPVFTNWDKSEGISITKEQISNLPTYITAEEDPKVGAIVDGKWCKSIGNQITCQDDLPALDEADPIFTNWDRSDIRITESQITDLQAYVITEEDPAVNKIDSTNGKVCTYDAATQAVTCSSDFPALDEQDPTIDKINSANNKLCTYDSNTQTISCTSSFPAEIDPEFANWDKSTGISITENQISDLQAYLTAEEDPTINKLSSADKKICVYDATAEQITCSSDVTAEEDPIFTNWDRSDIRITESQITDLQAYLTAEEDPKVGALIDGKWCKSIDNQITCQDDLPALNEQDPTIDKAGSINSKLCTYDAIKQTINCASDFPTESDPEFNAWDKSTGISITENQISDIKSYLTAEEDPTINKVDSITGKVCTYDSIADKVTCNSDFPALDEQDPTIDKINSANNKLCTYDSNTQTISCTSSFPTEEDPIFSNWDRSDIRITESQITDLQSYIIEEQDPAVDKLSSVGGKVCTYDAATQAVTCSSDFPTIDWTELTGVPAGFADGTDDGITNEDETDPTVPADVKAGIVDWANVQNIPPELADGDQVGILEETEVDKLSSIGGKVCIYDSAANKVTCSSDFPTIDWTELTGVPAGFIDGIDNGITNEEEIDPTVLDSVKDGVDWAELSSIPPNIIRGTGTTDTLAKWTASGISSSIITDTGTSVGIGLASGTLPSATLDVAGNVKANGAYLKSGSGNGLKIYGSNNNDWAEINYDPSVIHAISVQRDLISADGTSSLGKDIRRWNSGYFKSLDATGDINGGRLCIGRVCQTSWPVGGASFTSNYADTGILVKGSNDFDGKNSATGANVAEDATVLLGDPNHYIKSTWGSGVSIGTYGAPDTIVLKQSTGNVGIGTVTPTEKLEVAGNIKVSGTGNGIVFQDGSKQTTAAQGIQGYERKVATCNPNTYCYVACTYPKKILGGGCYSPSLYDNTPSSGEEAWVCRSAVSGYMQATAICALVS